MLAALRGGAARRNRREDAELEEGDGGAEDANGVGPVFPDEAVRARSALRLQIEVRRHESFGTEIGIGGGHHDRETEGEAQRVPGANDGDVTGRLVPDDDVAGVKLQGRGAGEERRDPEVLGAGLRPGPYT